MERFWALLAGMAVGAVGVMGLYEISESSQPHCPDEDSCVVDYHDNAWHVTEVKP